MLWGEPDLTSTAVDLENDAELGKGKWMFSEPVAIAMKVFKHLS